MSALLLVALVCYVLGALIQWLPLRQKFQEFDEYSNFPIVWTARLVTMIGCFIEALVWPCSLIFDAR